MLEYVSVFAGSESELCDPSIVLPCVHATLAYRFECTFERCASCFSRLSFVRNNCVGVFLCGMRILGWYACDYEMPSRVPLLCAALVSSAQVCVSNIHMQTLGGALALGPRRLRPCLLNDRALSTTIVLLMLDAVKTSWLSV